MVTEKQGLLPIYASVWFWLGDTTRATQEVMRTYYGTGFNFMTYSVNNYTENGEH